MLESRQQAGLPAGLRPPREHRRHGAMPPAAVSAWGSEVQSHVPGAAELAKQCKCFFTSFPTGARAILGCSCSNEVAELCMGTANSHWLFPGAQ